MLKALLAKTPTWLWLLLSVIAVIFLVAFMEKLPLCAQLDCTKITFSDKAQILTAFIASLSLIYLGFQVGEQRKTTKFTTDYLNRPQFKLTQFSSTKEIQDRGKAELCSPITHTTANHCIDDHWFNIENTGLIAAENLKIALFHAEEKNDIAFLKSRWLELENVYPHTKTQYKLPSTQIHTRYFQPGKNDGFLVLLEYTSAYSKIKHRNFYRLSYTTLPNVASISSWHSGGYEFYSLRLFNSVSYDEVNLLSLLKMKVSLFFNKKISAHDWLNSFIEL